MRVFVLLIRCGWAPLSRAGITGSSGGFDHDSYRDSLRRRDRQVHAIGDSYIEHKDGTLDVTRGGTKDAYRYESEEWTPVDGDHRRSKKRGFWR